MKFQTAVEAAPAPLNEAYRVGKRALKNEHKPKVECARQNGITGSMDLDGTLARTQEYRSDSRWDYGIGYNPPSGPEYAVWIEVHPASTSNVGEVLAKHKWLKEFLRSNANELLKLTDKCTSTRPFIWLATRSGTHINSNSPQARQLQFAGFDLPRQKITLP